MTVSGTCGNQTVQTRQELLHLLRNNRKGTFGEFWFGEKTFPVLTIHINGDLAYMWYSPSEGHPGFNPIGTDPGNWKDQVKFYQEGQGGFSMGRAVVVTVEQAYQAAAEFFDTQSLPRCIEWTEL